MFIDRVAEKKKHENRKKKSTKQKTWTLRYRLGEGVQTRTARRTIVRARPQRDRKATVYDEVKLKYRFTFLLEGYWKSESRAPKPLPAD